MDLGGAEGPLSTHGGKGQERRDTETRSTPKTPPEFLHDRRRGTRAPARGISYEALTMASPAGNITRLRRRGHEILHVR